MSQGAAQQRSAAKRCTRSASLAAFALAAVMSIVASNPAKAEPASVIIDTGAIEGLSDQGLDRFLGIPYAAAPVGERRWRAPAPPAPWSGVRAATAFSDDCPQRRPPWDRTQSDHPISEDCLGINVWRPSAAEGPLPVMVWIHGGGFVMGSSSQTALDGGAIARRGVIVVSFNYRIGRFGFFAHPALSAEQAGAPLGNYGMMDQLAALGWVQRNIAAFGGDPGNVTIFGESAGGTSVLHLMVMEEARGLFHRAIAQSSAGRDRWPMLSAATHRPSAEAIGERFAREAGLQNASTSDLRALPMETVMGRVDLVNAEENTFSGPIVDGTLVTGSAADGFRAGRQVNVPLLIGFNSNELGALPGILRNPMARRFANLLGAPRRELERVYGGRSAFNRGFVSDFPFAEPARFVAGVSARAGAPTYLYVFDYVSEARRDGADGASHATDVPFVFSTMAEVWPGVTPADQAQSDLMIEYWTNFAKSGDPNSEARPPWNLYAGDSRAFWFTNHGPAERDLNTSVLDAIESAHGARQP